MDPGSQTVTLRIRDTLTREVRPIDPLEPGRVRMYTCGPTVYRYAHVGNLRSYLPGAITLSLPTAEDPAGGVERLRASFACGGDLFELSIIEDAA